MRTWIQTGRLTAIVGAVLALLLSSIVGATADGGHDRAKADRPAVSKPKPATAKAAQTLTWTADNSTAAYKSAPKEAVAGPTTIVFENSEATGNTSGMQHTLTFDTTTEGYNHDVDVDILAFPEDENNGKWSVDVVLTEGTYRFHCIIPGHGQMQGELLVTGGGGDPGDDTTPPKATAKIDGETNDDGAYIGSASISVTATDEDGGSGVDTIEYQVDDTGWKTYADPVVVDEVGDHTIGYRATDNAGNTSEAKTDQFTIVEDDGKDTAPPKVEVMLHGDTNNDGGYVGSAEVMVNATDAESGVDTVEYKLDGGDWQAYADPFKVNKVGEHTVAARATDKAGNASEPVQQKFTVVEGPDDDTEAPTVNAVVQGEQDSSWNYVGAVTVKVSANDSGSGVDKVEYKLGDGDWQAYEDPVEVEDEGDHVVSYRATDAAGNTAKAKKVSFTIIAELPEPPACANPDPSPKVVMGDIGTGVRNRIANGNCTIDDLIHDEAHWANHAPFVDHAKSVLRHLREDGIVTPAERRKILSAARRSDVGRR